VTDKGVGAGAMAAGVVVVVGVKENAGLFTGGTEAVILDNRLVRGRATA